MLLIENPIGRTYYDILGAKEDASYEELRTSYRSSILISHPDKLQENDEQVSQEKFLEVQRAWEVLGNSRSRAAYDIELEELRHDAFAADDIISLEDLAVEIVGEIVEMFYQCRCGDYYSIDSSELADMGYKLLRRRDGSKMSFQMSGSLPPPSSVLLSCRSCSLRIHLSLKSKIEIQMDDSSKFS